MDTDTLINLVAAPHVSTGTQGEVITRAGRKAVLLHMYWLASRCAPEQVSKAFGDGSFSGGLTEVVERSPAHL
jgi:hypothetical protein